MGNATVDTDCIIQMKTLLLSSSVTEQKSFQQCEMVRHFTFSLLCLVMLWIFKNEDIGIKG